MRSDRNPGVVSTPTGRRQNGMHRLLFPILLIPLLGIPASVKGIDEPESTPVQLPKLPARPTSPGRFGAYYCQLKYSDEWDAQWRVGPYADVVVQFDQFPYRFVFCWVTENGIWYTNEFLETDSTQTQGCCEPMSDKQCRYSHVRIIESNDARIVVHWRYALNDVYYHIPHTDSTDWGDWGDEYYILYPDGVCVRKIVLWSSALDHWHEWQEAIVINPPGTKPEDNIQLEAATLANMKRESHTYSWISTFLETFGKPENANLQIINLKAKVSPFTIVPPEGSSITPFVGRAPISAFHCWNHWPVAQEKSWTTVATDFNQVSHTSLSHIDWPPFQKTEKAMTKILLNGMTDKTAAELIPLAKSWLSAPKLRLIGQGFTSAGYDPALRAYVLMRENTKESPVLKFELRASSESPVTNPWFVIKGWGNTKANLMLNGQTIKLGKAFRLGYAHTLKGTDIIVWIQKESTRPIKVSLSPVE